MLNALPKTIDLGNAQDGYTRYRVTLEPAVHGRVLHILTFACDQYHAIEKAWSELGFCDLSSPAEVRMVS